MRQQLGVAAHERLLLVTPGGGEDGYALVDTALRGLAGLPAEQRPRMHIVCGPEMAAPQRARWSLRHRPCRV
jgi:predicted glycosyltransferase